MKDEQHTIRPLYEKLCAVLESFQSTFELIFIDDGSEDESFAEMKALHEQDSRVRVFRFWRNAGKSPALAAGFDQCRGEIVFTLDGDLQDDPEELPMLLKKLNEGYDIVSGWKQNRRDPWIKRWLSWVFNTTVSRCTGLPLHDVNCGLKVYRGEVIRTVRVYGEMHRFIPVLAAQCGFRVTEIPVTHHPRTQGKSKYGMERMIRGLVDFITVSFFLRYGQRPAHLFGFLGLCCIALGGLFGMGAIIAFQIDYHWSLGITMLCFTGIGFAIGVQMILMGLFAELMTRFHYQNNPAYVINERLDAAQS